MKITVTWNHIGAHKPTIYDALKAKLGREPSHAELIADVRRILNDGTAERAGKGKLKFQR